MGWSGRLIFWTRQWLIYGTFTSRRISGAIIGDESIEQEDPLGWLPILDSRDFMINIDGLNELWSAGDGVVNGSHGTVDF